MKESEHFDRETIQLHKVDISDNFKTVGLIFTKNKKNKNV